MTFEWDAENRKHIARHGITPEEAEEAVRIEPLEADVQHHESEERVLCFGRTKSGRLLTVLYTERNDKDPSRHSVWDDRGQQRLYFEGK